MSAPPDHWDDRPVTWDILYITGHKAPGMVESIDVSRGYKVDEKGGAGVNGATLTTQGQQLANVTIKLKLWTRKHLQLADLLVYSIFTKPRQTNEVKPFDFKHPILEMHGLRSLLVTSVSGPTKPDEDRFSSLTLTCKEFAPPPPKPKASATSTPKAAGAPSMYFWTAEEEQLLQQLEAQRAAAHMTGVDTSKLDERIWNLKKRKAGAQFGPPSPPKGPGSGTPSP